METLTLETLKSYAAEFAIAFGKIPIPELYGVNNGKIVGTAVELTFHQHLEKRFIHHAGNAASGIDLPELNLDLKATSVRQPQSSCPFRSASQKVYGLGYHLLVFVYDKVDDSETRTATLNFQRVIFIDADYTADFQTTRGILEILKRGGNKDDIIGFLEDRNLPLEEIGRADLAERILSEPPREGVLTMSNALQWRLQYGRAIGVAGEQAGVEKLL